MAFTGNQVSNRESIPLIARAYNNTNRTAIVATGVQFSYTQLLDSSQRVASCLLDSADDLNGARVAFMVSPDMSYVDAQWGIWRAGGIAVPLCGTHPPPELEYVLEDSGASIVIGDERYESTLHPLAKKRRLRYLSISELRQGDVASLPEVEPSRNAMLIYTSGTTGKPKGALTTHEIIAAQLRSVTDAWEWSCDDYIINVLPLHHVHGILNVLCSALWSGATCELLPRFDADEIWHKIEDSRQLTLFMAVPTIYAQLIARWDVASTDRQVEMSVGCKRLRLMVCGSAALPISTLEKWRKISGHTLLERYGMTEIGMALTNPLHGKRRPGYVGSPFPGVTITLLNEKGEEVPDGEPGQIHVKGPNVFKEYWMCPEATYEVFTKDGWFKTGDISIREGQVYRILGRQSVDILKTGGYKVSAFEIEDVLRIHEAIAEVVVVGVSDLEWGQRVAAAVVFKPGQSLKLESLREWGKQRLAPYKVPTSLLVLEALPRNSMGKVIKPAVIKLFDKKRIKKKNLKRL